MTKPYHKQTAQGVRLEMTVTDYVNGDPLDPVHNRSNFSWTDSADGSSLPNWKELIATSQDATTPFFGVSRTVEKTPGSLMVKGWIDSFHTQPHSRQCEIVGDMNLDPYHTLTPGGIADTEAIKMADSQFYDRAHSAIASLEGGELLGEIGETVKEVKRLSRDMSGLFRDWRRTISRARRIGRAGRAVTGIVSDAYLRWKFGWDPLAKDVQALANNLKDDFVEVVPIKANGSGKKVTQVETTEWVQSIARAHQSVRAWEETSVRYKAGVTVKRYGVGGFAETLGLSPRNFLPTVYNLLPWTYMIDYFSNMGSIVTAIAFDDARIAWSNCSVRRLSVVEIQTGFGPLDPPGAPTWENAPGYPIASPSTIRWTAKTIARSSSRPLVPGLSLRLPNFQNEGGRIQGLNIAAVLAARTWSDSVVSRFRRG